MTSPRQSFWEHGSFAVVGHSAERNFPKITYKKLRDAGKTVYAVDPSVERIDDDVAYRDLASLPGPVEAAVLELPKDETADWVARVADAGIGAVWIHQHDRHARGARAGARARPRGLLRRLRRHVRHTRLEPPRAAPLDHEARRQVLSSRPPPAMTDGGGRRLLEPPAPALLVEWSSGLRSGWLGRRWGRRRFGAGSGRGSRRSGCRRRRLRRRGRGRWGRRADRPGVVDGPAGGGATGGVGAGAAVVAARRRRMGFCRGRGLPWERRGPAPKRESSIQLAVASGPPVAFPQPAPAPVQAARVRARVGRAGLPRRRLCRRRVGRAAPRRACGPSCPRWRRRRRDPGSAGRRRRGRSRLAVLRLGRILLAGIGLLAVLLRRVWRLAVLLRRVWRLAVLLRVQGVGRGAIGAGRLAAHVGSVAEPKDRIEDEVEQPQAHAEAPALAKITGDVERDERLSTIQTMSTIGMNRRITTTSRDDPRPCT